MAEFVRCVNGDEILTDWAQALNAKAALLTPSTTTTEVELKEEKEGEKGVVPVDSSKSIKKVRPHVLKVDVEGHDYEVMSFVAFVYVFCLFC